MSGVVEASFIETTPGITWPSISTVHPQEMQATRSGIDCTASVTGQSAHASPAVENPVESPVQTVVGAGPAGLAAAITFAAAGHSVRVLERHKSVGHRFHGDMQGLENWSDDRDVLERIRLLGIDTGFAHRGFDEVTFYDSGLRGVTAHTDRPLFYLVRRGPGGDTLDGALLRQAQSAGVDVRFDQTAGSAEPGAVIATGPEAAHAIAAGFVFATSLPDQAHAIVHPGLAPGGYAYLLIWDGRATLATCMFRDLRSWRRARDATVEAFCRLVPGLDLRDPRPFGGYGAIFASTRYTDAPGRLYAGEAAGLQDAEWGFGMVTALQSGVLAARCLLNGTVYADRAHRQFDQRRAAGLVNRAMFDTLPRWLDDAILRTAGDHTDLSRRMRRHWAPNRVKTAMAPRVLGRYNHPGELTDHGCGGASCLCLRCLCGGSRAACSATP